MIQAVLAELPEWPLAGATETALEPHARGSRRRALAILTLAAVVALVLGLIAFTSVL